jgi:hypothetical protein
MAVVAHILHPCACSFIGEGSPLLATRRLGAAYAGFACGGFKVDLQLRRVDQLFLTE